MGASFSRCCFFLFTIRAEKKRTREEEAMDSPSKKKRRSSFGGKSLQKYYSRKRGRRIASCSSPSPTLNPNFNWYEEDIWTEVAKFLGGRDLLVLGMANKWFYRLMMEESIWMFACLRDLQVPLPIRHVSFKWLHLYMSAFDGSHSYTFRQKEKHIDWMRIGAFLLDSPVALLTDKLAIPRKLPQIGVDQEKHIRASGCCLLSKIRTGIWIADLQLVSCPVCNLDTCKGTMQLLDARHFELFLEEGYRDGSWEYMDIGSCLAEKPSSAATGAIFDLKHLWDPSIAGMLDAKSWIGKPEDWQPKARLCRSAVAVNTNVQPNDGLQVKFQAMMSGDGPDREVVSVRILQQLI